MLGRLTLGLFNINNIILAQAYAPPQQIRNNAFWSKLKTLSLQKRNSEHLCKYDIMPSIV